MKKLILVILFSMMLLFFGCEDESDDTVTPFEMNMISVPGDTLDRVVTWEDTLGASYVDTFHIVLDGFMISETELTQDQYLALKDTLPGEGYGTGKNYPVYNLSWLAAVDYCNVLSIHKGYDPCYSGTAIYDSIIVDLPADSLIKAEIDTVEYVIECDFAANGYRLPTEAEWVYASTNAGASSDTTYSGSEDIDDVAWYYDNAGNSCHEVKQKEPNEWGLYDMSGNVWEWCWDWYAFYPPEDQNNPHGPDEIDNGAKVLHGGAWYSPADECRSDYRSINQGSIYVGLRLVRKP